MGTVATNHMNRNKSLQRKYQAKKGKPEENDSSSDTSRTSSESDDDVLCGFSGIAGKSSMSSRKATGYSFNGGTIQKGAGAGRRKVFFAKQSRYTPWLRLGERRYSAYSFLTWALDVGEWSTSRPGRILPRGKDPLYPLYRRLGGPQSRSGTQVRGKILCLYRGSNPDRPVVQAVVRQCTD
jgi:hypothetical protein